MNTSSVKGGWTHGRRVDIPFEILLNVCMSDKTIYEHVVWCLFYYCSICSTICVGDIDLQCIHQCNVIIKFIVCTLERLRKWRERDHDRCIAQIAGEKQATLQWKSTCDCERMANKRAMRDRETWGAAEKRETRFNYLVLLRYITKLFKVTRNGSGCGQWSGWTNSWWLHVYEGWVERHNTNLHRDMHNQH